MFLSNKIAGMISAGLITLCFFVPPACADEQAQAVRKVQKGDTAVVNFSCAFSNGELAASSFPAEDASQKKSSIFAFRDSPLELPAGSKFKAGGEGFDVGIANEISLVLVGLEVGKPTRMVIKSSTPDQMPEVDRFAPMARVWKRKKVLALPKEKYEANTHRAAVVGDNVRLDKDVPGVVESVTDKEVTLKAAISEGDRITTSFGTGTVHDKGDIFEIDLDAKLGGLVRVAHLVGRIVEVGADSFTIDFGYALAGEALTCDVTVTGIQDAPPAREEASPVPVQPTAQSEQEKAAAQQAQAEFEKQFKDAVEKAEKEQSGKPAEVKQSANAEAEKPDEVQKGDLALVDFSVFFDDGSLLATSNAKVAENKSIKKSEHYRKPGNFEPQAVVAGGQGSVPGLANLIVGMHKGEKKKITVPQSEAYGDVNPNLKARFPLTRTVSASVRLEPSRFEYLYKSKPAPDAKVNYAQHFTAAVASMNDNEVVLNVTPEGGQKFEDPQGTTEIRREGDLFIVTTTPKVGSYTEVQGKRGRIVEIEGQNYVVDFNHPLAGKNLTIEARMSSFKKASTMKDMKIKWVEDHETAVKLAKKEKKPVVILLYADWCPWCKRMLGESFEDVRLRLLKDKYVFAKVNSDKEKAIADLYQQQSFPMTVILGPDGKVQKKIGGFRDADMLLNDLRLSNS